MGPENKNMTVEEEFITTNFTGRRSRFFGLRLRLRLQSSSRRPATATAAAGGNLGRLEADSASM